MERADAALWRHGPLLDRVALVLARSRMDVATRALCDHFQAMSMRAFAARPRPGGARPAPIPPRPDTAWRDRCADLLAQGADPHAALFIGRSEREGAARDSGGGSRARSPHLTSALHVAVSLLDASLTLALIRHCDPARPLPLDFLGRSPLSTLPTPSSVLLMDHPSAESRDAALAERLACALALIQAGPSWPNQPIGLALSPGARLAEPLLGPSHSAFEPAALAGLLDGSLPEAATALDPLATVLFARPHGQIRLGALAAALVRMNSNRSPMTDHASRSALSAFKALLARLPVLDRAQAFDKAELEALAWARHIDGGVNLRLGSECALERALSGDVWSEYRRSVHASAHMERDCAPGSRSSRRSSL